MEKTTVYLPNELKQALRDAVRKTGRSEADLIREGISIVTREKLEKLTVAPLIPLFVSGVPDLADRAADYLEGFGEH